MLVNSHFKDTYPGIPTKSGIMIGLGETDEEVEQVMHALHENKNDLSFSSVTSGPLVRSSYHAERQAASDKLT